ncbi:MAG: DUF296 domain-containing protein [Candidatus ainarchaeum sp.]|nr:DUF296 domain-containing protein [Candidatus ainarchaeum sp.]
MVGNLILKINDNVDVINSIKQFIIENNLKSGLFVGATGFLKNFELLVNEQRSGLRRQKYDNIFDIDNVSGKFQIINGKINIDLKLSGSCTGFTSISGQLVSGLAASTIELEIKNLDSSKMIIA